MARPYGPVFFNGLQIRPRSGLDRTVASLVIPYLYIPSQYALHFLFIKCTALFSTSPTLVPKYVVLARVASQDSYLRLAPRYI